MKIKNMYIDKGTQILRVRVNKKISFVSILFSNAKKGVFNNTIVSDCSATSKY